MHELAIAESIVDIASRHAGERRVTVVDLRIGSLRQVVPSALAFAFELVAQGTPVEAAELRIEQVEAAGACRTCGAETALPDFPLMCTSCGSMDVQVTSGEELLVDSLELDDEQLQTTAPNGGRNG